MSSLHLATRPDRVAVLTIDQPGGKVNVLSEALWAELGAALTGLAARTDLAGLVIASGKPTVFIAGADLKLLADAPGPNDPAVRAFIGQGLRVLEQLEALPFPTCAAIDGAALGGGLEVALACDSRLVGSGPRVQLGLPEVNLGLIPGWGGTQRLPRLIGVGEAAARLTSGRADGGPAAVEVGLADAAVDSDQLIDAAAAGLLRHPDPGPARKARSGPLPEAERAATPPLGGNTTAAREAVRVVVEGGHLPLAEAIRVETEAFMGLAGSAEAKLLIAQFFAARRK